MEKISFKLITNGETIIDKKVNYYINNNKMYFIIDKDKYSFDINDNILTKENNESLITIDMQKNIINYYLKSVTRTAYLPLEYNNLIKEEKSIIFNYKVPENDIENTIMINY